MPDCICIQCGRKARHCGKGLCNKCYSREYKRRRGAKPRVPLDQRFWSKVKKTQDCWLWIAYTDDKGYGSFFLNGKPVGAHRLAYELSGRNIPKGMSLDHRFTCPKNCVNPEHLRPASAKHQNENRRGARKDSRTGIRGVTRTRSGKWEATVWHNKKRYYLGIFATSNEADRAARARRNQLYTHNDIDRLPC